MNKIKKLFSIVIPAMNEQEVLPIIVPRLLGVIESLNVRYDVEIIFIDDGSKDKTLHILKEYSKKYSNFRVISFSRNFGHQLAITAGMKYASGDYIGIIDADLQDPPELFDEMLKYIEDGNDIVYGKRISRSGESFFKKITAKIFYRLLNLMSDTPLPLDTGDFRIISRDVVNQLNEMPEKHRYVRGMIPWIGYKSYAFEYMRKERVAGDTKYPLKKMISFAANAILSFSSKPLDIAFNIGLFSIMASLLLFFYLLYLKLFSFVVPGITVIIAIVILLSGIQILLIGLVGRYIAKIFEEVKQRPLYIIKETINF